MGFLDRAFAKFGGIASAAELERLGFGQELRRIAVHYGSAIRVRKGLYCSTATHPEVIRALRAGGRLACISVLAVHVGEEPPPRIHIAVPANTPRVRTTPSVVVHWSRRTVAGDRGSVSLDEACQQARRCRER